MSKDVRRRRRFFPPVRSLVSVMILVHLISVAAAAAMDVATARLGVGTERVDGVLEARPYFLDVTVEGYGLSEVRVTTPQGTALALIEVMPGIWWNEMAGYSSLDDLLSSANIGFGDFMVDLVGDRGENDRVTLYFDPGYQDQFTGYGEILFPAQEQEPMTLEPTFQWECAGGCFTRSWDVRVVNDDGTWRFRGEPRVEVVTWAPGPVNPYESYRFSCQSFGLLEEAQALATDGGDSFTYETLFQTRNEVLFAALERIELYLDPGQLAWTALTGEVMYEVVTGDLNGLRATDGRFSTNTEECLANDLAALALPVAVEPGPGEGSWFLVRSVISPDGYESLMSSQQEDRTTQIAGSGAACAGYSCPPDVPAFYSQPNRIAGGVCVEAAGIGGPAACPEAQYARAEVDMASIKTAYPFTEAVEGSATGSGQQWKDDPFRMLCAAFDRVPLSGHVFDDLNGCYQAASRCSIGCSWVEPEFDWAVNVWSLIGVYDQQAARYDGWCQSDGAYGLLNPPGGFHAVDNGDGSWLWTVRSTSECDSSGCKCDAVVQVRTEGASPGAYWEESLANHSTPACTDPQFSF